MDRRVYSRIAYASGPGRKPAKMSTLLCNQNVFVNKKRVRAIILFGALCSNFYDGHCLAALASVCYHNTLAWLVLIFY